MASGKRGGIPGSRPAVLTRDDVRALFDMFVQFVSDESSENYPNQPVVFTGNALAVLFQAYSEHLITLMNQWQELSGQLRSEESTLRARGLRLRLVHEILPKRGLFAYPNEPYLLVGEPQAHEVRSLISGKGMEI